MTATTTTTTTTKHAYRSGHCNPDVARHHACTGVYGTSQHPGKCSCTCHLTQPAAVWSNVPITRIPAVSRG